ncbi:cysteine desulfurase family protein [Croceicoccus sp. F390]|uniref:Cysteine desulfurase n=1 Tax=Croceicoccus esteveae TaxID=3075597 RepID=A0ABU2ZFC2_9SPHN|nr:cysteine desulfurase family protein [Croceicoccus sp. F390]MDT0574999.1 cysteine desulfurase family protein [Croceicoccus sp. F390]
MIYLDYQATTPLAPEAREAMLPWLDGPDGTGFGNPHSPHRLGRMAQAAVELALDDIAALFPPNGRIVLTSGGTEAINLGIRGSAPCADTRPVLVSAIEHAAVLDTAAATGAPVVTLPVTRDGIADIGYKWPEDVRLACIMQVNNEIGTIQPIAEFANKAREAGALLLCDAVQAYGKLPVAGADMIAVSAHKLHGPKGIGALWVADGIELVPQITGGGQQGQMRSGTLSPALCAGFAMAARLARMQMEEDAIHVAALQRQALASLTGWTVNGSLETRWPGNLNLRKDGLDVARLMSQVRSVAFSAGSACASGSGRPSHVLRAIGLDPSQTKSAIRLGFGRYTTSAQLEEACVLIETAAEAQLLEKVPPA